MFKPTLFFFFLSLAFSISIDVEQKVTCLYFHQNHSSTFYKFSVFAHRNSSNTAINILTLDGKVLESFVQREGQGSLNGLDPFKICFQSLDRYTKHITFDVWEDNEHDVRELAKKKEYAELDRVVQQAASKVKEIARNERFHTEKQDAHFDLIVENSKSLRFFEIAKMLVMSLLVGGQILFFKLLLGNKKVQTI